MRITLFITCFNDLLFPSTGVAVVRILEKLGHQVVFPPEQTCCGQIHFNTGYRREAVTLLRRFVQVFGEAEVVVAPSASCTAMVREQFPQLAAEAGSPDLASEVEALGVRTFEMSRFLVEELGVEDLGATFPRRVALHPTCHSTRGIDVGDAPRKLLKAVRGLDLVELPNQEECCGFGGTFSVKNPHTSLAMMDDKIQDLVRSGAQVLTAVDNSCLAHIGGGLHRQGRTQGGLGVMHLAEILAAGWESPGWEAAG